MITLLHLVVLLAVMTSIVGGCGMEMPYIVITVVLIKLAWMVTCWWRTFQQERDNAWLHRRLACGAVVILILSISQLTLTYVVPPGRHSLLPGEDPFSPAPQQIATLKDAPPQSIQKIKYTTVEDFHTMPTLGHDPVYLLSNEITED